MPEYSYNCINCDNDFSLVSSIKDYQEHPKCSCGSKNTERRYTEDCLTINSSVKKSDSELKTIGDLANRNRDKMSEDQKMSLHNKHNSYKETGYSELPSGVSRMKKPKNKIG
jgi:putative FmdB family regulatory protein